jgi:hypothetical protein
MENDKDQLRPANASACSCKCNKFFHASQKQKIREIMIHRWLQICPSAPTKQTACCKRGVDFQK